MELQYEVKVRKINTSTYSRVPKKIATLLNLKEGDFLTLQIKKIRPEK